MNKTALVLACVISLPATAQSAAELDTLVVSATRVERALNDAPVRTEVVSRYELDHTHARSLKEALENVPGLQLREIHGKSGYEASLQGLSSDQLLILIDGMPLAASTGSSVDLNQLAVADIERIEIIKGAASAQYGSSAMGGVINIITRQAEAGLRSTLSYDAGSYGKQNIGEKTSDIAQHHASASLEGGNQTLKARLSADLRNNQGFDANPGTWVRQGDDSERTQYAGQLTWHIQDGAFLAAEVQQFQENDKQWLPETSGLLPNKYEDIERLRVNLNAGYRFAGGAVLNAKALQEDYRSDSYKQNLGYVPFDKRHMRLDTDFLSLQLDLPSTFLGMTRHQWQIGSDLRRERLTQIKDGVAEIGSQGQAARENYEVFVQDDYFFSENGELVLGLRVQNDSDFGLHSSPKAALKYRAFEANDQQVLLRISVGTGYRVPNLKERYYTFDHSSIGYVVMGNPDLDPETSVSYQAGVLWQISAQQSVDINAFYNDIQGLIQTDKNSSGTINGAAVYRYQNIDSARTFGLESVYNNQLNPSLRLNLSHTYTQAHNQSTGEKLTQKPEHIARVGLDYQAWDRLSLGLRGRFQSRELAATAPKVWSPSWYSLDLKASYQATPALRAFAGVDNLTQIQRDFSSGTDFGPIAGRFIYLGLQLQTDFF
ncbi:MAG: hypothetical protein RL217_1535 [Pseudomonadota bacterium]|jgi:outer membrane receptor for ferrienterochelin and colicins